MRWSRPLTGGGLLALAGGAAAAATSFGCTAPPPLWAAGPIAPPAGGRKRALRVVHLTDIHVQPERSAGVGLAACLRHVGALADPPRLVLNGGDSVMDAFAQRAGRATEQADLFRSVLKRECPFPVEHCIGNHDVWGWDKARSRTTGREPLWGKAWALDLFGLDRRYRSFDRAGWHFVVLDSVYAHEKGYTARLDEEQFHWLAGDLAAVSAATPICVLSHIPILSVTPYLDGRNERTGDWVVPGAWMHIDARRIVDLFGRHPNVKLCLSGHEHQYDRCLYNGVWYVCNGAVCGNWWKGSYLGTPPGYGLLDLYADGTFDAQYVAYGWVPEE